MTSEADRVEQAMQKCEPFGVHPLNEPLGELHHTEVPFTPEDEAAGDALAWFLGSLFVGTDDVYWHSERTAVDEWQRVVRALRIHGLKIVDIPKPEK